MPALPPPAEFPFIPNARPHSIDDRQLDKLALIAEDARMGNVTGVVKTASIRSRKVEVWLPRAVVPHYQARRRSFRRVEVTPLPGRKGHWITGPVPALKRGWTEGPLRRAA